MTPAPQSKNPAEAGFLLCDKPGRGWQKRAKCAPVGSQVKLSLEAHVAHAATHATAHAHVRGAAFLVIRQ
ncbi:MAG: hypothetical protein Q8O33_06110, partial [Pseudomonadota bacterium]|nr:hypothetical protein [Pseudomonadota bacterium]